jgi:hypothetical protein
MTLGAARVIYQINDLSMYVDQLMRGYVVVLIKAERGPLWTPIPVASWDEYERIFGRTFSSSADPLVLKVGLLQGAKFLVVRMVHCEDPGNKDTMTAVCSTVNIQDAGSTPTAAKIETKTGPFVLVAPTAGEVTGTEVGPFTFATGVADSMKITVGSGAEQSFTLSGVAQTAELVVDQINAATNGLTASVVSGKIKIVANLATDGIAIGVISNDAYSILGFVETNYSSIAGNNTLVLAFDGGADQTFTLTPGTKLATQLLEDFSEMTGGGVLSNLGKLRFVSSSTGLSSAVQIKANSTCLTALNLDTAVHNGTAGISQDTLGFAAKNPGKWGDSLTIQTYPGSLDPENTFDVRVSFLLQGDLNEYFGNLSMDPEADNYAVTQINQRSQLVTVTDLFSENVLPTNMPAVNGNGVAMSGGDDGLIGFNDADYIGDELVQTGIYSANQTDMSIDIMIPGTSSISVLQALVAYCENDGGYIAYANPPAGCDPMNIKAWRMGEDPYSHEAFNSNRLSLFAFRPLCYDSRIDSRYYISNLGMLASCISKTDTEYDYIYAPVGPRRGTVDFVEGIDFNMDDYRGYQDLFAEYGINYLMITRQKGIEGAVFWEQYTTQRAASALRDLNVMRFLTMMRRVLVPVLRMFLFEPNHPVTWREIHRELEPVFQQWKDTYSIYDFELQTDRDAFWDGGLLKNAILNTGLSIDQGIYKARVLIQPTRAIRYLQFTVGVMRTGESFSEVSELNELPRGLLSN